MKAFKGPVVTHLAEVRAPHMLRVPRGKSLGDAVTPALSQIKANTESLVC